MKLINRNMKFINQSLKVIFTFFVLFSAIGELTFNEVVVKSMVVLQLPTYLLWLLGILKIMGLIAIWFSRSTRLKEWAYAGFVFDFLGAIYCCIYVGHLEFPDIYMASFGMFLVSSLYMTNLWKNENKA